MTKKDAIKVAVITKAVNGSFTVKEAAKRLGLSPRRIKQLKKDWKERGELFLTHGNRGKASSRKTPQKTVDLILEIRKKPEFIHSNFAHFQEILALDYELLISYSTLCRILKAHDIKSPKAQRKRREKHPSREPKHHAGELLQADATPYEWFGGDEQWALHGFIDDAPGCITGLYITKNECLLGYLEVLRQTLENFGIPEMLYPDKASVFFVNPKSKDKLSIEEQLEGYEEKITQFGKIVKTLGVDMSPAGSPQAKGKIERLWGCNLACLWSSKKEE